METAYPFSNARTNLREAALSLRDALHNPDRPTRFKQLESGVYHISQALLCLYEAAFDQIEEIDVVTDAEAATAYRKLQSACAHLLVINPMDCHPNMFDVSMLHGFFDTWYGWRLAGETEEFHAEAAIF